MSESRPPPCLRTDGARPPFVDGRMVTRALMGGQVEVTLRDEKCSIDHGAGANAKGIAEAYAS